MDLAAELARFGPGASWPAVSLDQAEAYCRRLATSHYENFTVASRLFPRRIFQHLCNVYAYCRWADDLADQPVVESTPLALLDWWEAELHAAYAGEARHPVFVALRRTITEFDLPPQPLADLLVAFRRDQMQTRYGTLDELQSYCHKSANPVGRIVLYLGRSVDEENVRLSNSICTGLQLANFWQDVKRDYDRGRIYIPRDDWSIGGWDESRFAAQQFDDGFRRMLEPLVADAEARLKAGQPLVRRVARDLRLPVSVFIGGGQAILAAIRQSGYDVWSRRPTVSRLTKLRLIGGALLPQLIRQVSRGGAEPRRPPQ
jgi:squalene synthase HpnC